MTTHLVNLDALLKREDFDGNPDNHSDQGRPTEEIKLGDLEGAFAHLLRKPDFQRSTNNWSPAAIAEFVRCFIDGDVIPGIIMWRNPRFGEFFVIDGAHRISSLIAFVLDDYGDRAKSEKFWNYRIPPEQKVLAEKTRKLIESQIGSYQQLKNVLIGATTPRDDNMRRRASNSNGLSIRVQWVPGNAENAEQAFFRINNSAVQIDPTELEILKARKKPNAIAARALANAGVGHKYWSNFDESIGKQIESLAKEIWDGLFTPLLQLPVKTTDLPIAGEGYSAVAFRMIFDLINQVNGITPAMWQDKERKRKPSQTVQAVSKIIDDTDGNVTVALLKTVKKAALLISGSAHGSLGLHPLVYFYTREGRLQPAAFLATIRFMMDLKKNKRLYSFTKHRAEFEEYVIQHHDFVSALGHQYGSRVRSLDALVVMYDGIFQQLKNGVTNHDKITDALIRNPKLRELKKTTEVSAKPRRRKNFGVDEKSAAYLNQAVNSPIRCYICNARLHSKGFNIDHVEAKRDGGTGDATNAKPTHFYCNDGYRQQKEAIDKKIAAGGAVEPEDENDPQTVDEPNSA